MPTSVKRLPCEVRRLGQDLDGKEANPARSSKPRRHPGSPSSVARAVVAGDFDILLEVQATKVRPLARLVNERVRDWPGVVRIEAGFADMRNEP